VTDNEIIGAIVSVTGVMLSVVGMAVKTTRAVSRAETEIRSDMDAQIDNLQRDVARLERSGNDRSDLIMREFGETVAAVRQKINDVELNSERAFVAKGDFDDFRKEYREDMRDLKSSIANLKT
jgi:hypothetical protein